MAWSVRAALIAATSILAPISSLSAQPAATAETSPALVSKSLDAADRKRIVEAALAKIGAKYVFPRTVAPLSRALRRGLAGKYRFIAAPQAFVDAVNADIEAVAGDRHMRLLYSPEPLPALPDASKPDSAMERQFAEFMAERNYAIRHAQVLDGNIGYLKVNGFLPAEQAGATVSAAMAFLKNADAMIIDLRDNGGGDPGGVALLISYFEPAETLINTFQRRGAAVPDQVWTLPYVPGGRWSIDKPVYVLTSGETASGAEEFAYDLQQLKRATIVGARTWGGANPGEMVPIDDHFAIFVPGGSAVNPISKTNWEGTGVQPDVPVKAEEALSTSVRLALEKLMENSPGDRRAELQKFLDAAQHWNHRL